MVRLAKALVLRLPLLFLTAGAFVFLIARPSCVDSAHAQTVFQQMSSTTTRINSAAVNCTSAASARWTGWVNVAQWRNVVWGITFTDANASAASFTAACETTTTTATAQGAGQTLPVIVATSTLGVSDVIPAGSYRYLNSTTGAAAVGTFTTTTYIENLPAPYISCTFTCGAGGAAADTINVTSRTITP